MIESESRSWSLFLFATDSYSMNKGADKENSNNLLSMIERSLKEAPLDDRNAERITLVSITILYFFIVVLHLIPNRFSS